MMNNIILNGINSNTIQGLIIQELPPISKPAIRTEIEEIDGRDGDVITKLGYAAYDKQLSIGLYGNYDINQVISFFNTSGTVTFSNEPDKYYNYQILNEIDFERLVRFRTAIVTMHVQPFKYSATETPQELSGIVITGEGSNIKLVNTTDSGLFTNLQKKGDTFQQTYSGKNLFKGYSNASQTLNGITRQWNADTQTITLNGTCTANNTVFQFISPVLETGKYSISYKIISGSITPHGNNNSIQILRTSDWAGLSISLKNSDDKIENKNINAGTYNYSGIRLDNGTVCNNFKIKIQLEQNSTATDWEPYVGGIESPNPNYPQEIETVTGNNVVNIYGKNLLPNNAASTTKNGVTFTVNEDKSISITGTATADADFYLFGNWGSNTPILALSSGTYTLSCMDGLQNKGALYIGFAGSVFRTTNSTNIFTITDLTNISFAFIRIFNNQSVNITLYPQLEKGSTATDYEVYTSQTYPISLENIELCQINGAYDYIYKNNDTWYLHKVIDKTVLNGGESWEVQWASDGRYGYKVNIPNIKQTTSSGNIPNLFCNYYMAHTQDDVFNIYSYSICKRTNQSQIIIRNDDQTSLADFKNWLSTHNTKVYYELKTPTDTEITDSTLLSQLNALGNATTYLGTTNISTSGDGLSPIIYVETVAVDDPVLRITNSGNTIAKPIMTLYGTGTINLSLNGEQIFVIDLSSENYITIDIANMEAYYNGILKNRLVTGNYENFVLNQGENEITFTGTLYSLTISNYSRWI